MSGNKVIKWAAGEDNTILSKDGVMILQCVCKQTEARFYLMNHCSHPLLHLKSEFPLDTDLLWDTPREAIQHQIELQLKKCEDANKVALEKLDVLYKFRDLRISKTAFERGFYTLD